MGPWGSGIVLAAIAAVCVVVLLEEPSAAGGPDAKRGEEIFRREAMCLSCHTLADRGISNAPALDHVGTKFIGLKGGREQARRFFHDHLVDPKNNPGTERRNWTANMPSFLDGLGEEKIADICEFLLTLE